MRRAMYVEATGRATIADPKVLGVGGVFRTLSAQHSELSRLLSRAEEALDSVERRDLWMDIRREHLSHEGGEQQVVYAALQQWEKTRDLAVANEAEALELQGLIEHLDATDTADRRWNALVRQFAFRVRGHASEEETVLFPFAEELLTEGDLETMDIEYLAAKARIAKDLP